MGEGKDRNAEGVSFSDTTVRRRNYEEHAMPTNVQAQVVLPFKTNLPRDVAVNSFGFTYTGSGEPDEDDYQLLTTRLSTFYNTTNTSGYRLADFMSQAISVDTGRCRIRYYDAAAPDPGGPLAEQSWTFYNVGGPISNLPAEVAVCLSFAGDPSASMPAGRRRGRIFLGPLSTAAMDQTPTHPRVGDNLTACGIASMVRLYEDTTGSGSVPWVWSVWSRTAGIMVPITNGWINNEPDTQRRRQPRSTARSTWAAS